MANENIVRRLEKAENKVIKKDLLIEIEGSGAVHCQELRTCKPVGLREAQEIIQKNSSFILFLDFGDMPETLDFREEWHREGDPDFKEWLQLIEKLREGEANESITTVNFD